ncbi:MAG: hypothetical protein CMH04_02235 [Marinovum sp.]|nr:hypothetical protein [Marinovum sp.]|tara:strand:- start:365 stop:1327 length:963 start_codon:yes stop_codon:yes gene_type:complete
MPVSKKSQGPPKGAVLPKLANGKPNPKYVDLLSEDKAIAGQKFACVSFVSPEGLVKQREIYFFEQFLKNWELTKSLEAYTQFLSFISYKYNLKFDDLTEDLKSFVEDQKDVLRSKSIEDDYKTFLDNKEEELDAEFSQNHEFQTAVRGLKIRGCFPTQQEAELRCKHLREADPDHDVYVGPVGMWMPWHPEAYKTGRVEYMEAELNQLMSEKKKNEDKAKQAFDARVREAKEKAIEDNISKAKESGNKLTQSIDEEGQLVGVKNSSTIESALSDGALDGSVATADIRRELFEGDNIVLDKDGDHGLSRLENQVLSPKSKK